MKYWRVDYDDDDFVWLDLVGHQDRVMMNHGFDWIPFCHFVTPLGSTSYLMRCILDRQSPSTCFVIVLVHHIVMN